MPLISVIIPSYNSAELIAETIKSVQNQTFTDWEIIVVDDGSTDNTQQIVEDIILTDSRIKYFFVANNGVSSARNYGVDQAKSEFIAFLDSDDIWYPDRLKVLVKFMEENELCGVAYTKLDFLDSDANLTGQVSSPLKEPLNTLELLIENRVCTSSNIFTRIEVWQDVGGFIPDMSFSEDQEWLFRVSYHEKWNVQGIVDKLMGYRVNDSGLSSNLEEMYAGWEYMLKKISDYAPKFVEQHKPFAQAIYYRYLSRRALRLRLDKNISFNYYKKSLKSDIAILWTEPQRSIPTLIASIIRIALPDKFGNKILEIFKVIPKIKETS